MLGRPLIGLFLAVVITLHSLAAATFGFAAAVGAGDPGQAFALCTHDGQGNPISPNDPTDRTCVQHCLLCLDDLKLALAAPEGSPIAAIEFKAVPPPWTIDDRRLPAPLHAIAQPRGPPYSA